MQNLKLIIFDWDGTLADSIYVITECILKAFADMGIGGINEEKAKSIIGLSLTEAVKVLMPENSDEERETLLGNYKKHFLNTASQGLPLFEGVSESLKKLRESGMKIAVATGKSRAGLERDFAYSGAQVFLDTSRTVDECKAKPDPHMILDIMSELGVVAEETLMVGDTSYDLEMAARAGVKSIASLYGAHEKEKLSPFKPLAYFDNFSALSEYLLKTILAK